MTWEVLEANEVSQGDFVRLRYADHPGYVLYAESNALSSGLRNAKVNPMTVRFEAQRYLCLGCYGSRKPVKVGDLDVRHIRFTGGKSRDPGPSPWGWCG
jgi:hypothetical protein